VRSGWRITVKAAHDRRGDRRPDAIKAVGKRGQITLHEVFEERELHATTFNLSDVRTIEQHPVGAVVRFGLDGSGRFEACENLETIEQMVDAAR
jgi:hypothetical protein